MKKSLLKSVGIIAAMAFSTQVNAQLVVLGEAPAAAEGSYTFTYADTWGADMDTTEVSAMVVLYRAAVASDTLACAVASNAAELAGNIAFLYRGDCEFGAKSLKAQQAGAVAVIMVNNIPGEPVGMAGGVSGAQVTIPVVMISNTDGAALRQYVDAGTLQMFIGNKTGRFAYDAGFQKPNVAMAKSFATPVQFALDSTDFDLPVGAWLHNYGSENQTGLSLSAVITVDGDELYNETSSPESILAGDSVLVSLPNFALDNYPVGYYTLSYSVATTIEDEFPNDNLLDVNFWINDQGLYSKSRINPNTSEPIGGGGVRPATGTEFTWCTMLRSNNASNMKVDGVSFSTITNGLDSLEGDAVLLEVYEWNDIFDETTTTLTFTDLLQVGEVFYDYTENLDGEFVRADFEEPVFLEDGIKYLVCATIFRDSMFLTVDAGIDYELTYDAYPLDVFFPVKVGTTWTPGGFGPDNSPAIITHLSSATGIAEDVASKEIAAYPNPTADFISIPMGTTVKGNVMLNVFDMAGREMMSQNITNGASNTLRVDASSLSNGMHIFRLTFQDGTSTSFRTLIKK